MKETWSTGQAATLGIGCWGPGFAQMSMLICSTEVTSGSPTEVPLPPALTSPSLPLQWAKTLSTGPVFLTFFPLSFPCLPMQSSFKAPWHREKDLSLRLEKSICSYRDHKNVLLFPPILVPPVLMEHRALGVLPEYWLSWAAPCKERR